jgi:hypothetical protein
MMGNRCKQFCTQIFTLSILIFLLGFSSIKVNAGDGSQSIRFQSGNGMGLDSFIVENHGQFLQEARFFLPWQYGGIWIMEDGLWIQMIDTSTLEGVNFKLEFSGANPDVKLSPIKPLGTQISYFLGDDSTKWQSKLAAWGGVRYNDLYPGIDLVIQPGDNPTWAFEVRNDGRLNDIHLRVDGAESVTVKDQMLYLSSINGELSISLPVLYDMAGGDFLVESLQKIGVVQISGDAFEINHPFANAGLSSHIQAQESDSGLLFSTFFGGSKDDAAYDIVIDEFGAAYIVGRTNSSDLPVSPGAFDLDPSQVDVFIAKLNPEGNGLVYATYFGGSGIDTGYAIAEQDGFAYIVGDTWSQDFPGGMALQGENDIFIAALNRTGTDLVFTKLIGGSDMDFGYDIDISNGEIYLTGTTVSVDFPAQGYKDDGDAYVIKLDGNGGIIYNTILGGSLEDNGFGIAVYQGEAYVTGNTYSLDFPAPFDGYRGNCEAYLARIGPEGSLAYATFLGGVGEDSGNAIVVDTQGRSYVTGSTTSVDFPVTLGNYGGRREAFLTQFDPSGELLAARYLGGFGDDYAHGIVLDGTGGIWLSGQTSSNNFPISEDAYSRTPKGGDDVFLVRLDPEDLRTPSYSTYLGGSDDDRAFSVVVDPAGNPIVAGLTSSTDFPTTEGGFAPGFVGSQDAFITKFNFYPFTTPPTITPQPPTPTVEPFKATPTVLPDPETPVTEESNLLTPTAIPITDELELIQDTPGEVVDELATDVQDGTSEVTTTQITPTLSDEDLLSEESGEKVTEHPRLQTESKENHVQGSKPSLLWIFIPVGMLLAVLGWLLVRRIMK